MSEGMEQKSDEVYADLIAKDLEWLAAQPAGAYCKRHIRIVLQNSIKMEANHRAEVIRLREEPARLRGEILRLRDELAELIRVGKELSWRLNVLEIQRLRKLALSFATGFYRWAYIEPVPQAKRDEIGVIDPEPEDKK